MSARQPVEDLHPGAPPRPTLLDVAIHEAGHAVLGMCQPPPLVIRQVWVDLDRRDKFGCCVCSPRVNPEAYALDISRVVRCTVESRAMADVVDTLGGPVAEELFRRRSIREVIRLGEQLREELYAYGSMVGHACAPEGYVDLEQAERILLWLYGLDAAAEAFTNAWERALYLVIRHRHAIKRLALMLSQRRSLGRDQIIEIVGPLRWPRQRRQHRAR